MSVSILKLGVFFVCVLSCVVSGGGPDTLLPTDCVSFCCSGPKYVLPLQTSDLRHLGCMSRRGCKSYIYHHQRALSKHRNLCCNSAEGKSFSANSVVVVVVVDLGFTTLLTSQIISVAFYSEREKSNKFFSGALISTWSSFTCCKSTTRDPRLYFPAEGNYTQDFTLWNCIESGRVWTREPRIQRRVW